MQRIRFILVLMAVLLGAVARAQETANYSNGDLNLTFDYPKTWDSKTVKYGVEIHIPIEGASDYATLFVTTANFRDDAKFWEQDQAQIAQQLKHDVARQWREEILGVPLLLTRTTYTEKDKPMTAETILLYNQEDSKILFRLTAPTDAFENVDYAFRQALQSLRTIDGKQPKPEDPSRPKNPGDDARIDSGRPSKVTRLVKEKKPSPIQKAPVTIPVKVAGGDALLRIPDGWTHEISDSGVITLHHKDFSAPVIVTVASTLDSDQPISALLKASSKALDEFLTRVDKREEKDDRTNQAGAVLSFIFRTGATAQGPASTLEAVGTIDTNYWLLTCRSGSAFTGGDRKLLENLIETMSVDVGP